MNAKHRVVAIWFACCLAVTQPQLNAQAPPQGQQQALLDPKNLRFNPGNLDETWKWIWWNASDLRNKLIEADQALQANALNGALMEEFRRNWKGFDEELNKHSGEIVVWEGVVKQIAVDGVRIECTKTSPVLGHQPRPGGSKDLNGGAIRGGQGI